MNARKETISNRYDAFSRRKLRPDTSTKLRFIEGMRAVAALYVVIGHICGMVDPRYLSTGKTGVAPWLHTLMAPFWHGHLAVAAFIVLSGFCLQFGLYQRDDGRVYGLKKFFKRRALRILPAYYACLAFSIIVCLAVTIPANRAPFNYYLPLNAGTIFSHVFMVQNWSIDWMYKINGVLWSIGIETQLYLIFPFLILLMQKRSPLELLATVGIPAFITIALLPNAGKLYSWFGILFVCGMLAAHFAFRPHKKLGSNPPLGYALTVSALLFTVYTMVTGKRFDPATLIASDLAFGIATAAYVYTATISPGARIEKLLSARWLVSIGVFSYSLYLIHHPLLQILHVYRPSFALAPESAFVYQVLIGLPIILAISWTFSRIFEKPFVKSRLVREVSSMPVPIFAPLQSIAKVQMKGTYAYLAGPSVDLKQTRPPEMSESLENPNVREKVRVM
jgi:peptidoglycan/LPS O-acetylase OafA/YrhL